MSVTFHCEFGQDHCELTLLFTKNDYGTIDSHLNLSFQQTALHVLLPFVMSGYEIWQFLSGLEELHGSLKGNARLMSFDEDVEIWCAVRDSARGRVVVGGRIQYPYFLEQISERYAERLSEFPREFLTGMQFRFGPFECDQSCLPSISRSLREFLEREHVATRNPWEPDR